ncbi:Uncharacterised protein [Starkeya nomas]|uniref:Uncharacterized protein n=2 Tax=Starkeya nomas TaxID=2666134 RepID=A0A5S9NJJ6_9HYPH|nr:Uncharacterised protein [Starkeya nomas]
MSDYEREQELVVACILDHLSKVGVETDIKLYHIAEQAGFKERAILQSLRRLTDIEIIRPVGNCYEMIGNI